MTGTAGVVLDFTFFLFAVPAVIFAGISKGGFGSGAAFAATPFLALILDPAAAVGLMLPLLMLMDIGALRAYWRQWDWEAARALILGSLGGIALGTALFSVASPDLFRLMIGGIALGFVAYQLSVRLEWLRPPARRMGRRAGLVAGSVAGLTSFISHAGGPPAAIYLLSRKMTKTSYQATTVLTFWAINILKFGPYAAIGIFSRDMILPILWLTPVAFLGVWLGVVLHRKVSEQQFFALTYIFLTVTGAKLIWDALA